MTGDTNNETNFPHNLFLTDKKVLRLRKAFVYISSANVKLSKNSTIEDGTIRRIYILITT